MHVVFGRSHCMIMIEEHARELVVGGLNHLGFLNDAALEANRSRVNDLIVECCKVLLLALQAEVSWTMLSKGGEPRQGVAVKNWSYLEAMNMGRDRN